MKSNQSVMNANADHIGFALDIGTTKICALIGKYNEFGKLQILGYGKVASTGVSRGVVTNIDKTIKAIADAVQMAENRSGLKFKNPHVGIAGQHIKSYPVNGLLTRKNNHIEINQDDLDQLHNDMYKITLASGERILAIIPQEYTVDHEIGIVDPRGMAGNRIEANFHIVTCQVNASSNIHKCAQRAGIEVDDLMLEPIASSNAVLNEEEKNSGVILVDIGGGTTDITIFYEGIIRHTAVIPLGGNSITKDIREGLEINTSKAEELKTIFGCALMEKVDQNKFVAIPGIQGREPREISEHNLAHIIQCRLEEIFDLILWEIKRSGYEKKLYAGMVLTGGGALLKNIDEAAELHTGMHCRIGSPVGLLAHGYAAEMASPMVATSIGLLMNSINKGTYVHSNQTNKEEVPQEENEDALQTVEEGNLELESGPSFWTKIQNFAQNLFNDEEDRPL